MREGPDQGLGRIKGTAFREFVLWYRSRFGSARLSALPARVREHLSAAASDLGVLPNVWYPAGVVHELLDLLTADMDDEQADAVAQEAAIHVMNKTLRGVYRAVFDLFVTPERYSKHIDKLWALHYDNGRPLVETLAPSEHRITYSAWRSHHPFICRLNMSAAVPIYSAMGCKAVTWKRVACKSKGGDHCASHVRWST